MRSHLLAFGLVALVLGLFLLFAGYMGVGCSVGGTSANPTLSNCGGATDLEIGGGILTILALLLVIGSLVPNSSSRYR